MPHSIVRLYATRGGRGEDGKQPLTWVRICDMNDDWLQAVLDYYDNVNIKENLDFFKIFQNYLVESNIDKQILYYNNLVIKQYLRI